MSCCRTVLGCFRSLYSTSLFPFLSMSAHCPFFPSLCRPPHHINCRLAHRALPQSLPSSSSLTLPGSHSRFLLSNFNPLPTFLPRCSSCFIPPLHGRVTLLFRLASSAVGLPVLTRALLHPYIVLSYLSFPRFISCSFTLTAELRYV